MDLSKLMFDERKILYYGKYEYRASLTIKGSAFTRYVTEIEEIYKVIESTKKFSSIHSIGRDWDSYWDSVNLDLIKKLLLWKIEYKKEATIRIEGEQVNIYFNDLNLLESIENIDPYLELSKAVVLQAGVLFFKRKPKFAFRTYFKRKQLTADFIKNVEHFITLYGKNEHIRISSMNHHKNYRKFYASSYGFVDYNDESMLTILSMYFSGMIGETYKLEKRP